MTEKEKASEPMSERDIFLMEHRPLEEVAREIRRNELYWEFIRNLPRMGENWHKVPVQEPDRAILCLGRFDDGKYTWFVGVGAANHTPVIIEKRLNAP